MTSQEAIEIIKETLPHVESEFTMTYATAFIMAIDALERQIKREDFDDYAYRKMYIQGFLDGRDYEYYFGK